MFRLVLSCLVLGAALAKPSPKGDDPEISPRMKSASEPQPLPAPDAKERASYTLAAGSYYITSPNFPYYYPNGAYLSYTLQGRDGQELSISCESFNIESHSSCSYDFLSVNGQRFCGFTGPDVTGTVLDIVFSSDDSVRRKGFYCIITVPTGGGSTDATTEATTTTTTTTTSGGTSDGQCCGVANRAGRIVGGVETEVNEYPWQAGIVSRLGTQVWCGGTVINNRYVLTAAHCTAGNTASGIQVLLREHQIGTSDGEMRFNVEQIIDHPSYTDASGSGYDFSLLKLSSTIDFSSLDNKVAPACLPTGGEFANVDAIVSGWGTTSSGGSQPSALREVTVQTMTNDQCRQAYGSTINNSMLCAGVEGGGKDSCQGDSGGPLVTDVSGRYTLIGVVSWGAGCADARYPGVYARVTEVTSWIEQNTADASLC